MKKTLSFLFIIIGSMAVSPHVSLAQELLTRPIVRLIYFYPRDRAPEPGIDEKMDKLIKDVQQLYANQMEVHGFGRKTFIFQTDASDHAVVHHIRGKFTAAYYEHGTIGKVGEEINEQFDISKSIYLTVVDSGYLVNGASGVASRGNGRGGGLACINNRGSLDEKVPLTAHELGHTFGLDHDFRNRVNIMSSGWEVADGQLVRPIGLSKCTAELLDVHRYFNAGHQSENVSNNTKIQMLTPIEDPPNAIRLRFEITDVDGLHQAILYGGIFGTIGCKRLTGNSNNTVEFTTTTVTPRFKHVYLDVIDIDGNISGKFFPIDVTHLLPSKVVSVPNVNLAAAVRKALNLAPGDALTTLLMLELTFLGARDRQITDLTGLEYAIHLAQLYLPDNTISDISPISGLAKLRALYLNSNNITDVPSLAGLTQLTTLLLERNNITDIASLAGLTQLDILYLGHNNITDVSVLSELTNLRILSLHDNNVSDVSALTGLARLHELSLGYNTISDSDIAALSGLTQLEKLNLDGNSIKDVSALSNLTQLESLSLGRNFSITDVSALSNLTQLEFLALHDNLITDVSALSSLTQLTLLFLTGNAIFDVSPLVELDLPGEPWQSTGLHLGRNPLNYASIHTHIPAMQAKGVEVKFDPRTYPALDIISGTGQQAAGGEGLTDPFVVAAIDARGTPMQGVSVNFTVIAGSGELSLTNATTDAGGRAQTTLTLGPNPGINRVQATAAALQSSVPFITVAVEAPAPITEDVETPQHIAEDVNGDGVVNVQDLVLVSSRLGQTGQNAADVNGDAVINVQDLVLVAAALGEGAAAAPALHPSVLAKLSGKDIQRWLDDAKHLGRTDAAHLHGIAVLEQLLALLLSKETTLLANYPNPFNPETWIPYQLAQPTEVTLHIYAVNGALIRALALGHRPAGVYHTKNREAYWDGRNEQGEKVANGVYFYTLSAGDFTATRKMLIRK